MNDELAGLKALRQAIWSACDGAIAAFDTGDGDVRLQAEHLLVVV